MARLLARRSVQIGSECVLRGLVHAKNQAAQFGFVVGILRALGHGNAVALGQRFQSLIKTQALLLHHEFDDVAADAAGEAFVKLVHYVNGEGRRLLVVERAQPHVAARTRPAEAHVFSDDGFDPDGRLELFNEVHAAFPLLSPTAPAAPTVISAGSGALLTNGSLTGTDAGHVHCG